VLLGVVPDGDRIAHVIFRAAFDPAKLPDPPMGFSDAGPSEDERQLIRDIAGRLVPQVVTCRRQDDGTWRMIVGHDFFGLETSLFHVLED
jgi:hypothetical protein